MARNMDDSWRQAISEGLKRYYAGAVNSAKNGISKAVVAAVPNDAKRERLIATVRGAGNGAVNPFGMAVAKGFVVGAPIGGAAGGKLNSLAARTKIAATKYPKTVAAIKMSEKLGKPVRGIAASGKMSTIVGGAKAGAKFAATRVAAPVAGGVMLGGAIGGGYAAYKKGAGDRDKKLSESMKKRAGK